MNITGWNRLAIIFGVGMFLAMPSKDNQTTVLLLLGCIGCIAVRDILAELRAKP